MTGNKSLLQAGVQPEWWIERATHYCVPGLMLSPRHRHPDLYQVFKVLEGKGTLCIGQQRFAADAGGTFWIPPNVWHASEDPPNQSPRMIEIRFRRRARWPCPFQIRRFPYHIPSDHRPAVLACLHELVKEFTMRRPFWEWTASATLGELIALLAREIENAKASRPETHAGRYRIDPEAASRALDYIHLNYFQPIDLNLLARLAGMSVNRFTKVFRALEGTTPIDYLIDYRLKRANQMIIENRLTLTQIAEAVGFNSIHHFSNCYKKRLGIPPSQRSRSAAKEPATSD